MRITKPPTIDAMKKFASHFTIQGDCWVWNKPNTNGYGYFFWSNGYDRAHRWLYKAFYNVQLSKKQVCDHLCRNRACVNPKHIDIVAQRTNILRGEGLAAKQAVQTHCKRGHEFTVENTYARNGTRTCRACARAILKERRKIIKELNREVEL